MEEVNVQSGNLCERWKVSDTRREKKKGFRTGQSPCVLVLGNALQFSKEDIAGALWVLRAIMPGSKVELLAFTHCLAGCVE